MAGLIRRLRGRGRKIRGADDPNFDPGKSGQPSVAYSFVMRLLNTLARSFMVKRPDALRRLISLLIVFFANPENVASDALSPEEIRDLRLKFLRVKEPEITEPDEVEEG